jgi:hypothetical protein
MEFKTAFGGIIMLFFINLIIGVGILGFLAWVIIKIMAHFKIIG